MMKTTYSLASLLALASIAACSTQAPDSQEVLGTGSEPIINGTTVTVDAMGTALLSVGCSGTIIDGHWLLTAHHCATNEVVTTGGTPITPSSVTVSVLNGSSTTTGVAVFLHPTLDVALIQLASDLLDPATGLPFPTQLFPGNASSLVGSTVLCQGWGKNTFTTGSGTLRSASLPITQMDGTSYRVGTNSAGQVQWKGDSGGSCYLTDSSGHNGQVLGVQSTCNYSGSTVDYCDQVAVENFFSWASAIINLPADCTFSNATAGCVLGWPLYPGSNVAAELYNVSCSEPVSLKRLSGSTWINVPNDCDIGQTRTPPGTCTSPTQNAFVPGWQDEGSIASGPPIGSHNWVIACDSAQRCSRPFQLTIPDCGTAADQFAVNPTQLTVQENHSSSTLLTWSGPWVAHDSGIYDTFVATTSIPGGVAAVTNVFSLGDGTGQAYLSVSAPLGISTGSYSASVTATDQASGVSHQLSLPITVTQCVPHTCSASLCGTVASDDGCGGGPLNCGSCGHGLTCSHNVCCPSGETWNVANQECEKTCPIGRIYCVDTGTCLTAIQCNNAGGGNCTPGTCM